MFSRGVCNYQHHLGKENTHSMMPYICTYVHRASGLLAKLGPQSLEYLFGLQCHLNASPGDLFCGVTAQQFTGSWAGLTLPAEIEGSSRPAYNFSATIKQVTDSEPINLKQSILYVTEYPMQPMINYRL